MTFTLGEPLLRSLGRACWRGLASCLSTGTCVLPLGGVQLFASWWGLILLSLECFLTGSLFSRRDLYLLLGIYFLISCRGPASRRVPASCSLSRVVACYFGGVLCFCLYFSLLLPRPFWGWWYCFSFLFFAFGFNG